MSMLSTLPAQLWPVPHAALLLVLEPPAVVSRVVEAPALQPSFCRRNQQGTTSRKETARTKHSSCVSVSLAKSPYLKNPDHAGPVLFPAFVSWRILVPSRIIEKICFVPVREDSKAMWRPSGAHVGFSLLPASDVSWVF